MNYLPKTKTTLYENQLQSRRVFLKKLVVGGTYVSVMGFSTGCFAVAPVVIFIGFSIIRITVAVVIVESSTLLITFAAKKLKELMDLNADLSNEALKALEKGAKLIIRDDDDKEIEVAYTIQKSGTVLKGG